MREKVALFLVLAVLLLMFGCCDGYLRGPSGLDSLANTVSTLSAANLASTPINPYATPIHIALVGLSAILEALRRKERSARKSAEQKLNGNNSSS